MTRVKARYFSAVKLIAQEDDGQVEWHLPNETEVKNMMKVMVRV